MVKQAEKESALRKLEERVQESWAKNRIYEKVGERISGRKKYYFLDGPPYASGAIHLGTAWNKILKDAIVRYLVMRGYDVRRQAGWDCHGLPIEIKVEEKLGIKNKKDIEKFGVEKFVNECRKWAHEHVAVMTKQFKRLGIWLDWEKPYMTLNDEYIEAAWWTIKKADEKKLLVKELRPVMWCPRCETALAEAEIEYEEKSDPSIYVMFPTAGKKDEHLLVWTTTPWTLIGNLAVAVHPEYEYVKAKTEKGTFILAKDLVGILKEKLKLEHKVVETLKGTKLEGMRYQNPLSDLIKIAPTSKNAYSVILADFVTLEEGTGCVHTAPGHGPEDFEVGKKYGIEAISPVDERGNFTAEAGKYAGRTAKKDDALIIDDLKRKGALALSSTVKHRYGHCWRCGTPIIYRATEQWFIKVTALREQMLKEIKKVEWVPEWAGSARFQDWVEHARDWAISRQRYWGIPLPIWICGKCGKKYVVGSKDELMKHGEVRELHKPFVDEVLIKCSCGGKAERVSDVLDVWFDSGVAAWASLGYPRRKEEYKKWYPVDFITEGHDQTRGWFYSQLGCGILAFGEVPYRRVLMHGFTLDEKGEKMSKSLGNVVSPEEVIEKYSAEVLRFYVLWANKPWDDLRFNWEEVDVIQRMFNIFWNVYVFATTYMSIDKFDAEKVGDVSRHYRQEDRWLISRLNSLIKEVTGAFESLYIHRAAKAIQNFILEDLSRWYITLIRQRTWIEKDAPEKLAAYSVLHEVLFKLSIIMAPAVPHLAEEIYQNFRGRFESVHFESWMEYEKGSIDEKLEKQMDIVRKYTEAEISAREKKGIKRRWPVARSIVHANSEEAEQALKNLSEVVMAATNTLAFEVRGHEEKFEPPSDCSAQFDFGTVYIDTREDEKLMSLRYARELVRRIQQMRKEQNLDVEDFIEVAVTSGSTEADALLERQTGYISRETRAKKIDISAKAKHTGYTKEWDVEKFKFKISIRAQP